MTIDDRSASSFNYKNRTGLMRGVYERGGKGCMRERDRARKGSG